MIVWASEKEDNISYFDFASQMYDKLDALNNIELPFLEHFMKLNLQKKE